MPSRRSARGPAALALAALIAIATGCGGGDADPLALAAALPADAETLATVDFDVLRSLLDLPEDYDVGGLPEDGGDAELAMASYASIALPQTRTLFATMDAGDPVREAIDGSQISASAVVFDSPATAIVSTSQPFDEISGSLEDAGFGDDDGVLVAGEDIDPSIDAVADLGDGRIVLADEEETAARVVAGEGSGPAVAELLGDVGGPVRVASAPAESEGCVTAYAQGEDLGAGSGSLRLAIDGDPDPDDVNLDPLGPIESADEPTGEGDSISVGYTFAAEETQGAGIAIPVLQRFSGPSVYEC